MLEAKDNGSVKAMEDELLALKRRVLELETELRQAQG